MFIGAILFCMQTTASAVGFFLVAQAERGQVTTKKACSTSVGCVWLSELAILQWLFLRLKSTLIW
jgi:hypothetical protein